MRNVILIAGYSCLVFSMFSCRGVNTSKKVKEGDYDTLITTNYFLLKVDKAQLLDRYYIDFDIVIPKYFNVTDSLSIDLNADNRIDTLVLLTPVILEDERLANYLENENPKRLWVEIINTPNGSRIRNIYDNLDSNIGGVLSTYAGIYKTNMGFEIHYQAGSRYSWLYVVEFSTNFTDSIYIVRQEKTCSFSGNDIKQELFFEKASVKTISIFDSVDNNCNCDPIWEKLENTTQE